MGMIAVFFVYGLSFFILGIAIFIYPKKGSSYLISRSIWLVGAFGVLHGINEWIDMFLLIGESKYIIQLLMIGMYASAFSFFCLLIFGVWNIIEFNNKYSKLKYVPFALFIAWAGIVIVSNDELLMANIWSRYLFGAPGIFISSYALFIQRPLYKKSPKVYFNIKTLIVSLALYGVFSGLIVPDANFFPASIMNYSMFLDVFGFPVQIIRALCAIVMCISIINVLSMFKMETEESLKQYNEELENMVLKRTFELRSLNEQLEHEIVVRRQNESRVMNSLKEKEVLLREIHHRVKNNMAVISSLLSLQSEYVEDEKSLSLFKESQSRIKSMALIHEKLYQSDDFAHINVSDYVKSLAGNIYSSFRTGDAEVKLNVNIDDLNLDIDTLIPCGLIINEILTNSFKHAFDGHDDPEITITMKKAGDENVTLSISDNGCGLPDGYDISNPTGLGHRLIKPLIKQIRGTMEVHVEGGTKFKLTFPEQPATEGAD